MRITLSALFTLGALLLVPAISCKTRAIQKDPASVPPFDYITAWKKIDSLENKQLYQSALALAQEVREEATSERNAPQQVRAAIYVNKYAVQLNEEGHETAIAGMEEAIETSDEPARSVLLSLTAELYSAYVRSNLFKFRNRTNIPGDPGDDIRTWDIQDFINKINQYYLSSVAYAGLKTIPVSEFEPILTDGKNTDHLRPVLYDILAHRAIDHFSEEPPYLTGQVDAYVMTDLGLLLPANAFTRHRIESTDLGSYKVKTLRLFQSLMSFHLDKTNTPDALIDLDLKRLTYVYRHIENEGKDKAYLDALAYLESTYPSSVMIADVGYAKAEFYMQQAGEYTGRKDDPHRYDLRTAKQICEETIAKYPGSKGAAHCQNLLRNILHPSLSIQTEEVTLKGEHVLVNVSFNNVSDISWKVVRLSHDDRQKLQGRNEDVLSYLNGLRSVQQKTISLPVSDDYRSHDTETFLDPLEYGYYAMIVSDGDFSENSLTAFSTFHISDLAFWNYSDPDTKEVTVVHRKTGAPLEGVKADFYTWEYNAQRRQNVIVSQGSRMTDADGLAPYTFSTNRHSLVVKLTLGSDILFLDDNFHAFSQGRKADPRQVVYLFTDRSIYRPGQPIYIKGYLVNMDSGNMPSLLQSGEVSIAFMDVNGQEITKQSFKPNAFGTFSGEFMAPEGRLPGNMRFVASGAGDGSVNVQVEEYKRPTFEVTFDPAKQAYQLGSSVTVDGKAMTFAGVPIGNGEVQYRVVRKVRFPWYPWWRTSWLPDVPQMIIAQGITETDRSGQFQIDFEARGDNTIAGHRPEYTFEVIADVTDVAGETRSETKRINLAEYSFRVTVDIDEDITLSSLENVHITATNLNGEDVTLTGSVNIDLLDAPPTPLRERYWDSPDTLLLSEQQYRTTFPSYPVPGKEEISSWEVSRTIGGLDFSVTGHDTVPLTGVIIQPGAYKLTFRFTADNGDTTSMVFFTNCFDINRGLPPHMLFTGRVNNPVQQPGSEVVYHLLTSRDVHIRYLTDRQVGIRREWISGTGKMDQTTKVTEADRGGMRLHGIFVYDNRVEEFEQRIAVPWTNKELQIEYMSYRDKTEPGAQEEWHLRISGEKTEAVMSEMLATMYDASLDAFQPHQWSLSLYPNYGGQGWSRAAGFSSSYLRYLFTPIEQRHINVPVLSYRAINWFGFPIWAYYDQAVRSRSPGAPMMLEVAPPSPQAEADGIMNESKVEAAEELQEVEVIKPTAADQPVALRTDLRETVFFMPHIQSDAEGNVILKFKMNESLTRYKFMALAHTKDLKYGLSEKEIVTQKDLMVFPHMPRFLRQKDKITLTTKVHNMTDVSVSSTAELKIVDAATGADVSSDFGLNNAIQTAQLPASGSVGVDWRISVPEEWTSPVKYQVIARAGNKGDGEEGLLPVLTDRIFVTETMAMHIASKADKTFVFDALKHNQSSTLDHQRYTVEFTSNPAWLAVQSLPYLQEYPYQCAEQIWNRLYANQVARKIVTEFPEIGETYARWTADPESVSLMSSLSKNQELKSALLEETPWVRDAMSEEEQMRNIAILLDGQRIANETAKSIASLKQLQLSNGGFPWFSGGRDNRYITQYIVEGAGHLSKLEAIDPSVFNDMMQIVYPAIRYIDERLLEEYNELARQVSKGNTKWEDDHLSHVAAHYLYTRSFFRSQEMSKEVQKVRDYYLGQAEKYWNTRPLYVQSLLALSLHRWTQSAVVATMKQSFEERALFQEELGRYWKANTGYYWYELPIERQALMIELFEELGADQLWIDELRLWLLTNKQTNRWISTKATAAAVYALLMQEDNWLEGAQVAIRIAGDPLTGLDPEAGSGYIKESWAAEKVVAEMSEINVSNPNNHVAWGAAYWQYFEDMDKVEAAEGTPLKMRKTLHKQISTDQGLQLIDLSDVEVGDQLISRIEIEVDRDMEFVHLKDMRASGLEPVNVISAYKWQGGLGYYESTGDLATNFFFDRLPRGKYVFEYPLRVAHAGSFSNGIATLQCMYAPEFSSHSGGLHVEFER